ncbi:DUF4236 domain-containing protein, partial [bacterium]|nr:DUF4236 domain-containing protein [bacterium]
MRFQRRIKIAPGLRVNLSGSGIGFSAGPRGLALSSGPRGAHMHMGIPGTGISHASKLSSTATQANPTSGTSNTGFSYRVKAEDNGSIRIEDVDGNLITDDAILGKIKRDNAYKAAVLEVSRRVKDRTDSKTDEMVNLYKMSPIIEPMDSWQTAINELRPAEYVMTPFVQQEPTEDDTRAELASEAAGLIQTWQFWRKNKMCEEYINSNLQERLKLRVDDWMKKKHQHDQSEQETKRVTDNGFIEAYQVEKSELESALGGDPDYLHKRIEELFEGMSMPFEFSADIEIQGSEVCLDLDLPEIEDMPLQKATILATGKVKVQDKSAKELREDYARCVTGLGFYITSGVFNISPAI